MTLPVQAEPLPSSYTFGKVVGRVIHLIADTAEDTDDKPQARSASGRVTFTPKSVLRKTIDADYPAIVLHTRETATLSSSGRVLDAEGRQGIWLAVGVYTVDFEITGALRAIPSFDINVTSTHTDAAPLDLAKEAPYVPPTGTVVQTLVVPSGGTDGQALVRSTDGGLAWATVAGAVDSVNGQTGAVILDAADVGAQPAGDYATTASIDPATATFIGDDASQTSAALGAAIDSATHPLGVAARVAYEAWLAESGATSSSAPAFPMQAPRVLTSPPATAPGASSSSVVAGTVMVSAFEQGAFTYLGGRAVVADPANPHPVGVNLGPYPFKTSPSPVAVEFWLDTTDATGRFEILWAGPASQSGMRVAIQQPDGSWGYVTAAATFSHSNTRADLVTLGAAGVYRIRLEFAAASIFQGVYVGPTDAVTAGRARKRYVVVGDSFTEPTIDDTGAFVHWDGYVQQLSYLTGFDLWSAGSGGTGYLNSGPVGRVKFRDRLAADVLALDLDGIIWGGGINDGTSAPEALAAEALACFQEAKDAGVREQIVLSPFWPKTLTAASPRNTVGQSDAIKAAAESMGLTYLNLLELPDPTGRLDDWTGSTLQASASIGATTISVASIPTYMQAVSVSKGGWYVKIGTGGNKEVRRVTGITGTGPYTLALNSGLTFAQASGQPVVLSGNSYMTGTGKQGATTGSGNADRYTGNGGTHPTKAGMAHIARTIAALWARALGH